MSKKSKAASKLKRLQAKRRIRAANRARFDMLRKAGENSKSIRFRRNKKRMDLVNTISHKGIIGKCGNIACRQCYLNNS